MDLESYSVPNALRNCATMERLTPRKKNSDCDATSIDLSNMSFF